MNRHTALRSFGSPLSAICHAMSFTNGAEFNNHDPPLI